MDLLRLKWNEWAPRAQRWFEGLPRWQQVVVGAAAAIVALKVLLGATVLALVALILGGLAFLLLTWLDEFVWLMSQPDEVFPGRFDKPIWALVLVALPPVGLLGLWAFRRSRAGAAVVDATAKPSNAAFREWF